MLLFRTYLLTFSLFFLRTLLYNPFYQSRFSKKKFLIT